jgi:predicted TIM-barrel fold metal-dependent hydrolase
MFACDWPVFRLSCDEKKWVDLIKTESKKYCITFSEEELNLFFTKNVQDFLDMNL